MERSLLYKCKWKYHVPSTSQKTGLTGLYKSSLLMSTMSIPKPVFQEVYRQYSDTYPYKYEGVSIPWVK